MNWRRTVPTDQGARLLADRHYSRKSIGAALFCPPGRKIVLVLPAYRGLWVTGYEAVRQDGFDAWTCNVFRNESGRLASVLIRQALAATLSIWGHVAIPRDGLITFIDERKVQTPPVGLPYGWTFRTAGFEDAGRTKDRDLLILRLPFERLREMQPRVVRWMDGSRQLDLLEAS